MLKRNQKKAKGGVYAIKPPLENKYEHPNFTTLRIGHSRDMINNRFKKYNSIIQDDENMVENNINFILHSEINAFNGTKILESIVHWFFKKYRTDKKKEFFRFEKDFDIDNHFDKLNIEFIKRNIEDVKIFRNIIDVPYTKIPENYSRLVENKEEQYELIPRHYQVEIIDKVIKHYQKNDKGGIYLPPGYGKTYITIMSLQKLNIKKQIGYSVQNT